MTNGKADEIIEEAKDLVPHEAETAEDQPYRRSDGALRDKPPEKPTRKPHPLANSLRAAKGVIAEILKDADNLEMLQNAMQREFEEDPVAFVQDIANPLLEHYEDLNLDENETAEVRISVTGNPNIGIDNREVEDD